MNTLRTIPTTNYTTTAPFIKREKQVKKGRGVCCFIHNSILYKERKDLSINDENIESISLEIINKKRKNLVTNVYRPPNGKIKPFKNFFKNLFSRHKRSVFYFAGDFNLNLLDYETNTKVKNFFNLMFSFNLIPVINTVTRVTKTSVTAIDHIITNSYLNTYIQTGIIKTDISDHFPIFLVTNTSDVDEFSDTTTIHKRFINNETIQYFRTLLNNVTWEEVENTDCPESAYNTFLDKFQVIYDQAFPKTNIKTKN